MLGINPIWGGGGGVQHPQPKISSKTLKLAPKYPQISWLFLFLYDLSEKQKNSFFHSDFGCLEGWVANTPPTTQRIFSTPPLIGLIFKH